MNHSRGSTRATRFMCSLSWVMADLKTPLRRTFTFTGSDNVVEMARKGGADWTSADRQALEYAINQGRGAVWLRLTDELIKLR